jgi:hypothetical protein
MQSLSYSRQLRVDAGYDIAIVGGGPSGVAAAIAAGRVGRKVVLIEQTGCLGGIGTSGLVTAFNPYSDGERTLVRGIGLEVVQRAYRRGFMAPSVTPETWEKGYMTWLPFNGEGLKLLYDELALDAGVELRFFTSLIDVQATGNHIDALILSGKEGVYALRAHAYIDCSGDATLAAMAGLPLKLGGEKGETQAQTLCSLLANIDMPRYQAFKKKVRRPTDFHDLEAIVEQAYADGVLSVEDLHLPGIFAVGEDYGVLNAGHLYGLNCLTGRDLTRGMIWGRKLAQEYVTMYRRYVEGCEKMTHMATGSILGVRETRRIIGEYVLTAQDYLARRVFEDEIGRYNNPIDIHRSTPSREDYEKLRQEYTRSHRLPPGESYGIPYRALVPKGSENLWVGGRCISTERRVQGSTRVMPCCFVTGQAAGVAAALCCEKQIQPQDVDIQKLRATLREQGAYFL